MYTEFLSLDYKQMLGDSTCHIVLGLERVDMVKSHWCCWSMIQIVIAVYLFLLRPSNMLIVFSWESRKWGMFRLRSVHKFFFDEITRLEKLLVQLGKKKIRKLKLLKLCIEWDFSLAFLTVLNTTSNLPKCLWFCEFCGASLWELTQSKGFGGTSHLAERHSHDGDIEAASWHELAKDLILMLVFGRAADTVWDTKSDWNYIMSKFWGLVPLQLQCNFMADHYWLLESVPTVEEKRIKNSVPALD